MGRAMSLREGKSLWTGYRLLRLRGCGSFGQVWEAKTAADEMIALKFLNCGNERAAARELRNIQMVGRLSHPNLVRVDKVWADQGYVVMTMELADGCLADLLDICRQEFGTALPLDQVCDYLSQTAAAIDFLNARVHPIDGQHVGIQHGDIKPNNLLLFGEMVKLADFGLASTARAEVVSHAPAGTGGYAAPEVFQGRRTDWTDQYALAVTYCKLRVGRLPFCRTPSRFTKGYVIPEPDLSILPAAERPIIERALSRIPSSGGHPARKCFAG